MATVTVAQMILSCQNHKDTPKDRLTLEATNHRIVTVGHGSAEVYFNFHGGGSYMLQFRVNLLALVNCRFDL